MEAEGVMSERHITKKLKGKVLGACVTPAMLYGLETLPVTEKHQHRLQVCENNWVRRIAGVKSGQEEDGRAERGGWHTGVFDGKIGEESVEVGRTCRTNERGSTTKHGILCSPGEGKEKERKTTYEMARLHRERHEKGGDGGRGLEDGGPG